MNERQRGNPNEFEIIPNRIDLKAKTGDGPARLPREKVGKLERSIQSHRGVYLKILGEELNVLQSLVADANSRSVLTTKENRTIYSIAHRIRGEAAMNGQDAVGVISNLLCEYLDVLHQIKGAQMPFISLHVDAMAACYAAHVSETGDTRVLEIVEGFKAARAKLISP